MALFEQLGKKITDASHGVAKQTRDLTDTTRLNVKISENKKKMSQLLFEMGNDYYQKHRKDQNCEEQKYIDQLNALYYEILKYQKEIEQIKSSETCKVCGSRIAEDAAFCMACGAKKENSADGRSDAENYKNSAKVCPSCGSEVEDTDIFCMNCGKKL